MVSLPSLPKVKTNRLLTVCPAAGCRAVRDSGRVSDHAYVGVRAIRPHERVQHPCHPSLSTSIPAGNPDISNTWICGRSRLISVAKSIPDIPGIWKSDKKMYLAFVVSRLLKGIRAAAGGENIVVTGCQKSRDEAPNGRLIVHYKNGLLSVLRCGRFHRCHSLLFSAEVAEPVP